MVKTKKRNVLNYFSEYICWISIYGAGNSEQENHIVNTKVTFAMLASQVLISGGVIMGVPKESMLVYSRYMPLVPQILNTMFVFLMAFMHTRVRAYVFSVYPFSKLKQIWSVRQARMVTGREHVNDVQFRFC